MVGLEKLKKHRKLHTLALNSYRMELRKTSIFNWKKRRLIKEKIRETEIKLDKLWLLELDYEQNNKKK